MNLVELIADLTASAEIHAEHLRPCFFSEPQQRTKQATGADLSSRNGEEKLIAGIVMEDNNGLRRGGQDCVLSGPRTR